MMQATSSRALTLLAALAFALGGPLPAQDPPADPPAKPAAAPVERLTAWPKPADKDQLLVDVERLVKARTPEMGVQAREALTAAGASAVPFVLERYGKEKDEDAARRLREVLLAITRADQTRLLGREFASKLAPVRVFTLWRAAAFPDPELKEPAQASLARARKAGDKADPEEVYAAALCCASAGSTDGFDVLFQAAQKRWDKKGVEIRTALEGSRGEPGTVIALERLAAAGEDRAQRVAALRLLAGCGTKTAIPRVKPLLDDQDNSVRVSAINALRGIVDGDPPLEQLSVFDVIETAKQWKERV